MPVNPYVEPSKRGQLENGGGGGKPKPITVKATRRKKPRKVSMTITFEWGHSGMKEPEILHWD